MANTTTLENVINQVHQDSIHHFDETVPVHDMYFDSLKQMWISGKPVDVAPTAQRLFSNRLRVPYSYLSRCPEDLQARNLNYWIEQEQKHRDTFFCRFKHISNRGLENFPETLSLVIEGSAENQDGFILSRQSHVDNPMASIETFSRRFGLSQNEAEIVKKAFVMESGDSLFHVINAFTAAAKSEGLTTVDVYKFEKAGGQILSLVKS